MRISQEVVLGIGGVHAVRTLGYDPSVWHMNEGHSAFLGLERIRELVQGQGLSFRKRSKRCVPTPCSRPTRPCRPAMTPLPLNLLKNSSGNIGGNWG